MEMENLFVSDRFNNKWMIWKEITHACRTFKPRDLFLPANNDLRHVQKEKSPLTTKSLANHTLRRRHRNGEMTHGNVLTAQNTDARNIFPEPLKQRETQNKCFFHTVSTLCKLWWSTDQPFIANESKHKYVFTHEGCTVVSISWAVYHACKVWDYS